MTHAGTCSLPAPMMKLSEQSPRSHEACLPGWGLTMARTVSQLVSPHSFARAAVENSLPFSTDAVCTRS